MSSTSGQGATATRDCGQPHTGRRKWQRYLIGSPASLLNHIRLWRQRRRQRRALLELDDYQLADLGIPREAARREAARPFWT